MAPERMPGLMVRVLAAARRRHPDARLVVLSHRGAGADWAALAAAAGLPPHAVVEDGGDRETALRRLSGADAAVVLLEDLPRFRGIARPVKVGEYLAAGLPVVLNAPVADAELLLASGCALAVDARDGADDLERRTGDFLDRCLEPGSPLRAAALECWRREYRWEAHRAAYGRAWDLPGGGGG
jgi:glycosyltransferase involved in cell wall biosynthesis